MSIILGFVKITRGYLERSRKLAAVEVVAYLPVIVKSKVKLSFSLIVKYTLS